MREIKFRGWDKEEEAMVYFDNNLEADDASVLFGGKCAFIIADGVTQGYFDCCPTFFMQYTGLKDKNDKEIYEGDIIKYLAHNGNKVAKVIYEPCHFILLLISRPNYRYPLCNPHNLEIIGNIYEDVNLLP